MSQQPKKGGLAAIDYSRVDTQLLSESKVQSTTIIRKCP